MRSDSGRPHASARTPAHTAHNNTQQHTPTHRAGPVEFKAAFEICYEAAGRVPEESAAPAAGGLFGGLAKLFSGGGGNSSGVKRRPLEADLKALKSIDNTLLKLGAVYADAETR